MDETPGTKGGAYSELWESFQDAVFLIESDGYLQQVNQRFVEVTGVNRKALTNLHYTELEQFITGDNFPTFDKYVQSILTEQETEHRVNLEAHTPVEGDLVVEARMTAFDSPGNMGVTVVLRDLTELIETKRALELKSEQLMVVNRVLRHNIRKDLNIVLGWGGQLERFLDNSDGIEILDRVLRHSSHVVELTYASKDLLDAIEENWEMELKPMALRETLGREIEIVSDQYPGADYVVTTEIPEAEVTANEFLGSVFSNLLSNAARHNTCEHPHVEISVNKTATSAIVTIADNGPGLPNDLRDNPFEIGTKGVDSPGTGIGLYLVEALVSAYGGAIEIADNQPNGTMISVELPLMPT